VPRLLPDRIVENIEAEVMDLGQPQLFTLIQVGGPRQPQHQQDGGPCPLQTQIRIEQSAVAVEKPGACIEALR
jgi:hypothetical protein